MKEEVKEAFAHELGGVVILGGDEGEQTLRGIPGARIVKVEGGVSASQPRSHVVSSRQPECRRLQLLPQLCNPARPCCG